MRRKGGFGRSQGHHHSLQLNHLRGKSARAGGEYSVCPDQGIHPFRSKYLSSLVENIASRFVFGAVACMRMRQNCWWKGKASTHFGD